MKGRTIILMGCSRSQVQREAVPPQTYGLGVAGLPRRSMARTGMAGRQGTKKPGQMPGLLSVQVGRKLVSRDDRLFAPVEAVDQLDLAHVGDQTTRNEIVVSNPARVAGSVTTRSAGYADCVRVFAIKPGGAALALQEQARQPVKRVFDARAEEHTIEGLRRHRNAREDALGVARKVKHVGLGKVSLSEAPVGVGQDVGCHEITQARANRPRPVILDPTDCHVVKTADTSTMVPRDVGPGPVNEGAHEPSLAELVIAANAGSHQPTRHTGIRVLLPQEGFGGVKVVMT